MNRALLTTVGLAILLAASCVTATALEVGDIILNDFGRSVLQIYDRSGTLKQEFSGTGSLWLGVALTPDQRIATTYRNPLPSGVNCFLPDGTESSFVVPEVDVPGDLSVFADGTIAVNSQLKRRVELYASDGTHLGGFAVSGQPFPSEMGLDDTLWLAPAFGTGRLLNYNRDGTLIRNVTTGARVGGVAVDPRNGNLWIADRDSSTVAQFTVDGDLVVRFATDVVPGGVNGFSGIAVAPDQSLFVTSTESSSIFHYSPAGERIGSFAIHDPLQPLFLTVVVPEPTTPVLLLMPALVIVLAKWQRGRKKASRLLFGGQNSVL